MVLSELEQLLYIDIPMNVNKYFCKVHNTAKFTKLQKYQILNGILAESRSERLLMVGLMYESNLSVQCFTDWELTTKLADLSPVKIYTNHCIQ